MIDRIDVRQMDARQKAELIYGQARAELSSRLWRAALGEDATTPGAVLPGEKLTPGSGVDSVLAALIDEDAPMAALRGQAQPPAETTAAAPAPPPIEENHAPATEAAGLGPNARHQPALEQAARRTGIPAPALAAIVDAEAAKGRDGSWKLYSRNPRSSAAGLGQFLAGTWQGEAERPGTWLNQVARANGWLTDGGKVARGARGELLALRYDAEASINAVADYAKANLDRLKKAGVAIGGDVESIARSAYLGHHLGVGDAIRFLKDGLEPGRARRLLHAQIGSAGAIRHIAATGDATAAHRAWLTGFVDRHIHPERFAAA